MISRIDVETDSVHVCLFIAAKIIRIRFNTLVNRNVSVLFSSLKIINLLFLSLHKVLNKF